MAMNIAKSGLPPLGEAASSRRGFIRAVAAAGFASIGLPAMSQSRCHGLNTKISANRYIFAYAGRPRERGDSSGLIKIDPETSGWEKVSEEGHFLGARVAPGGQRLAYSRDGRDGGDKGLWLVDLADGAKPRRVLDRPGMPFWSADGQELVSTVSVTRPDRSQAFETWRLRVDEPEAAERLPLPETEMVLDWAPDGTSFVVASGSHKNADGQPWAEWPVYLTSLDGKTSRLLVEADSASYVRFSPDGRKVVYTQVTDKGREVSLWTVGIEGIDRRRLVEGNAVSVPARACWSPDGASLAVAMVTLERNGNAIRNLGSHLEIISLGDDSRRALTLPQSSVMPIDWV